MAMQFKTKDHDTSLGQALIMLRDRASDIEAWLERQGFTGVEDARHLENGTPERTYWHLGYATAVRDALRLITGSTDPTKPC
jgi:hypothetical protein